MTKEVKKIVAFFIAANIIGLVGVGFFVYSNLISLSYTLLGTGILLHAVWFILLLKLLLTKSDKQKQVLH